jgi:Zn-dependent protease with chaperone function
VVLDDPRPAAYCAAGRPAAIVVTSGALAVLDPPQLRAVLAHERAHLAGRHHALVTVVRGLAATVPRVPLFARGADQVARLTEMTADDAAARAAGRRTVAAALIALATGSSVPSPPDARPGSARPGAVLAAAAHAVPARVDRLVAPSAPPAAVRAAVLLTAAAALFVLVPALLAALTG